MLSWENCLRLSRQLKRIALWVYMYPWGTCENREEHGLLWGPAFHPHWWLSVLPYSWLLCTLQSHWICLCASFLCVPILFFLEVMRESPQLLPREHSTDASYGVFLPFCVFWTVPLLLDILDTLPEYLPSLPTTMSMGSEYLCQSFPELLHLGQQGEWHPLSVFTRVKKKHKPSAGWR